MVSKPEKAYPDSGWTLDRYATCTNEHLFRGHLNQPFCWIDSQWQRNPPSDHNNSRLGASQRWGPDKIGKTQSIRIHVPYSICNTSTCIANFFPIFIPQKVTYG